MADRKRESRSCLSRSEYPVGRQEKVQRGAVRCRVGAWVCWKTKTKKDRSDGREVGRSGRLRESSPTRCDGEDLDRSVGRRGPVYLSAVFWLCDFCRVYEVEST